MYEIKRKKHCNSSISYYGGKEAYGTVSVEQ